MSFLSQLCILTDFTHPLVCQPLIRTERYGKNSNEQIDQKRATFHSAIFGCMSSASDEDVDTSAATLRFTVGIRDLT